MSTEPAKVEKIFILADDDPVIGGGIAAKLGAGRLGESGVENVLAVKTFLAKIDGQRGWQLVINQKLHDA